MKWVGNVPKQDASRMIFELCAGWIGRRFVEGEPRALDAEGLASLKAKGLVGLYNVGTGDPVTVEIKWGSGKLAMAGEEI
jgi:hypothetical protein